MRSTDDHIPPKIINLTSRLRHVSVKSIFRNHSDYNTGIGKLLLYGNHWSFSSYWLTLRPLAKLTSAIQAHKHPIVRLKCHICFSVWTGTMRIIFNTVNLKSTRIANNNNKLPSVLSMLTLASLLLVCQLALTTLPAIQRGPQTFELFRIVSSFKLTPTHVCS